MKTANTCEFLYDIYFLPLLTQYQPFSSVAGLFAKHTYAMQANLNSSENPQEMDISGDLNGSVPFSHHDRNHSLPNTSLQNESGGPHKVKLNRAATVSKTENLKQLPLLNPAFNPDLSTPLDSFQMNQYIGPEIQMPDHVPLDSHINTVPNGSSMMHSIQMPIVDLSAAAMSIPDLQSTGFVSTLPNISYEDPSMRSIPSSNSQTKSKSANEGKNPSEYALHILFTQVCFTLNVYNYSN